MKRIFKLIDEEPEIDNGYVTGRPVIGIAGRAVTAEDAIASQRVIEASYESNKSKRYISL